MEHVIDQKNKKKAVQLTIEEYSAMEKEIEYCRNTIEKLQDELDSIDADKIRKQSTGTVKFQLSDYVSSR